MDNGATASHRESLDSNNDTPRKLLIDKLELPTPAQHEDTLHWPPRDEWESLWQSNLKLKSLAESVSVGEWSLHQLKQTARTELIQLATDYSRQYNPVFTPTESQAIVMAGHQPELFHPGVWYKNFLLSRLGQHFSATAINLVVDNDLCGHPAVRVPEQNDQLSWRSRLIPFDGPDAMVPFERRLVADRALFDSFGSRLATAIKAIEAEPIIKKLWPEVLSAAECLPQQNSRTASGPNLGASIAAGRHRLETQFGLQTLEVPLSQIAATESFAQFSWSIISDFARFFQIYNESLADYRTAYGLRSQSHPVPELEIRDGWYEIPFWIWNRDDPQRKRAYICPLDDSFLLGEPGGWHSQFKSKFAVSDLSDWSAIGVSLRPRALMTTLYCRLVLSDLFIHGIGGGKYDQLTNLIGERFFGTELPAYCVATATMKLPTDTTLATPRDVTNAIHHLRELKFHPERFVGESQTAAVHDIIQRKFAAIHNKDSQWSLKARHRAIETANQALQAFAREQQTELEQRLERLQVEAQTNQILGSREFSFCLFGGELIGRLRKFAT